MTSKHTKHSQKIKIAPKHINIAIATVAILFSITASFGGYLLYQEKQNQTIVPIFVNKDANNKPAVAGTEEKVLPEISQEDVERVQRGSATKETPGLENFVYALNPGSALPISIVDKDKTDGFKGGREVTLASEFDENGKREALVQSIYIYDLESAKNLKVKDYTQKGFEKLECVDVADECSLFFKKSPSEKSTIDTWRIFFRKDDLVFFLEYAQNRTHPEHDTEWLKEVSKVLANRVNQL
jgi:hypothetical protein